MKLSPICFAVFLTGLCVPAALANPQLARSWADEARLLEAQIRTSGEAPLSDELKTELARFGRVSARLANSGSETEPVPHDLACIFRGMAEETDLQLSLLTDDADAETRDSARERLLKMLEDAAPVGEAAAISLEAGIALDEMAELAPGDGQCSTDLTGPKSRTAIH